MKKLTLFIEDNVVDVWKRELHLLRISGAHLDEDELTEMRLVSGALGTKLRVMILDSLDRKEKILHLMTEVN